jgi:RNA polymerase sigma-70 factor, ECF subfamily
MSNADVPAGDRPADATLIARCLAGDKDAFGLLISQRRPQLRRLFWAMFGDPFEVDDLLQESFLQAYLGMAQLRQPERFGAWLYAIALNLARMRLRARSSPLVSLEELSGSVATAAGFSEGPPAPEAAVERQEVDGLLRQAIGDLPAAERQAVRRVFLDGLTHRETAEALGTTVGAVKVRIHRGRQRLRAALEADLTPARPKSPLKEIGMIEVTIYDVLAQVMQEEDREVIASSHRLVLLKETAGERILPIWIGPCEGEWIAVQLMGKTAVRPLTFALIKNLLDVGSLTLEEVAVSRLHEQVFYGTLTIRQENGRQVEVDCRPSDALTIALHLDAPIRVAAPVMAHVGIPPESDGTYRFVREEDEQKPAAECAFKELEPGLTWRSLRSLETGLTVIGQLPDC